MAENLKSEQAFICCTCNNMQLGGGTETKVHLETVHGITQFQGMKEMIMHMDGRDWYESQYHWKIPKGDETVELIQSVRTQRSKRDKMLWG